MRLIQVLSIVLTQFSVGTLLMTSLLPPREIRLSFFTLNSLLGAVAAALALVLTKFGEGSAWWDVRYLGLTVIGATVAFGLFKLEKADIGRVFLIVSGLLGLVFGLLPLSSQALATRGLHTTAPLFFDATLLAGAALLGATNVGMILGHWYLVTPKLPEAPLVLLAKVLLSVVIVQVVLFWVWIATGAGPADVTPFSSLTGPWALFVWFRLIVGLIFPLIVCWASVQTARTRSMESATGLLSINVGSIAAGTILAAGLYFGAGLLV